MCDLTHAESIFVSLDGDEQFLMGEEQFQRQFYTALVARLASLCPIND